MGVHERRHAYKIYRIVTPVSAKNYNTLSLKLYVYYLVRLREYQKDIRLSVGISVSKIDSPTFIKLRS